MYAIIEQWKRDDLADSQEIEARTEQEYLPMVQKAPGFMSFYLMRGDSGIDSAILIWRDKADADAFWPQVANWIPRLEQLGYRHIGGDAGEVSAQTTTQK